MKWEQAMEWNITCKDIWMWNPPRLRFLIKRVYDILPSLSNLYTWGRGRDTCMPAVFQARDARTDLEQLLQGTRQGPA